MRRYLVSITLSVILILSTLSTSMIFPARSNEAFAAGDATAKTLSISLFTTDQSSELLNLMKKYTDIGNDYVISGNPSSSLFSQFSDAKKIIGGPSLDSLNTAITLAKKSDYKVDVIAYDIEHWPLTPQEEQNDPSAAISKGADLVHQAGYRYGITPDGKYLLEYYQTIDWKKVDLLDMQLQRWVPTVDEFVKDVTDVTKFAKSMNPDIEVLAQVSLTLSSPDEIIDAVSKVKDVVDGVVVTYLPLANRPNNMSTIQNLDIVLSKITEGRVIGTFENLEFAKHTVTAQGYGDFPIFVASNSTTVNAVEFERDQKKVSIKVEGEEGTAGFIDVVIPSSLLNGNFTIHMDGNNVEVNLTEKKEELSSVYDSLVSAGEKPATAMIYKNETSTEIRIAYRHSSHTIDIVATNVIPEFPPTIAMFSLASVIGISVIVGLLRGKLSAKLHRW